MVQWLRLHTGHGASNARGPGSIPGGVNHAARPSKLKKPAYTDLTCKVQEMAQSGGEVGKADPWGWVKTLVFLLVPIDTHHSVSSCLPAFLPRSLFPTGLWPPGEQGLSHSPHGGKEELSQCKGVTAVVVGAILQSQLLQACSPVSRLEWVFFFPLGLASEGPWGHMSSVEPWDGGGSVLSQALPSSFPLSPFTAPPSLHYIIYSHVSPPRF